MSRRRPRSRQLVKQTKRVVNVVCTGQDNHPEEVLNVLTIDPSGRIEAREHEMRMAAGDLAHWRRTGKFMGGRPRIVEKTFPDPRRPLDVERRWWFGPCAICQCERNLTDEELRERVGVSHTRLDVSAL